LVQRSAEQSQLDAQASPLTPLPGAAQQMSVSTVQAPEAQSWSVAQALPASAPAHTQLQAPATHLR
jgi:hypothetical protein